MPRDSIRIALIAAALGCAAMASAFGKVARDERAPPLVEYPACSWNRPGVDPFMGDVVAAVDDYPDIPVKVRERLKARMAKRQYDELVSIRRDSIRGRAGPEYGSTISDMHFGTHQICRSVTRAAWSPSMQERGLVYCEGGQCILVPTICRNVSRISRKAVDAAHAEAPDTPDPAGVVPPGAVAAEPVGEPTATPLALDEVPSFARPPAWDGPVAAGEPGGPAAPGDWGPGGFPPIFPPIVAPGGPVWVGGAPPPTHTGGPPDAPGGPPGVPGAPPPIVPTPVPEPETWLLMLGGLAALALARRRHLRGGAAAPGSAR